jgi:hypothetical protein
MQQNRKRFTEPPVTFMLPAYEIDAHQRFATEKRELTGRWWLTQ